MRKLGNIKAVKALKIASLYRWMGWDKSCSLTRGWELVNNARVIGGGK